MRMCYNRFRSKVRLFLSNLVEAAAYMNVAKVFTIQQSILDDMGNDIVLDAAPSLYRKDQKTCAPTEDISVHRKHYFKTKYIRCI